MKLKRIVWTHFVIIFLFGLALTGCAGLAGADDANTVPVLDTGGTALNTAVLPNPPVLEEAITPSQNGNPAVQEALNALYAQEQAFISIYEQVSPAVVHIATEGGQGSGFVYDMQGYIVTNNHVVAGARQIVVTLANGRQANAQLIGTDPDSDLAVIQVSLPASDLTAITLADSEQLRVGQIVIAIGNPFGLSGTMTTGIISSLDRQLDGGQAPTGGQYRIPKVIQTDAAINPGNSGGPLLDLQGRVIGVNSAIRSATNSSAGIGFAVPANIVRAVVPQIIATGSVTHPWLGIAGGSLTPNAAEELGLSPSTGGVVVSSVVNGGPAAVAGLRGGSNQRLGDVITAVDGRSLATFDDLLGYIVQHTTVGQTITLQVLRDGSFISVPLTLGQRPSGT